jgi:hypothetical protein
VRERPVHGDHHAHHVHVGGQYLRLRGVLEGALTAEFGPAGKDPGDLPVTCAVGADPDPVARDRHAVVERVRQVQELVPDGGQDQVAVDADHPAGLAVLVVVVVMGLVGAEVLGDGGGIAITCRSIMDGSGYGKAVQAGA